MCSQDSEPCIFKIKHENCQLFILQGELVLTGWVFPKLSYENEYDILMLVAGHKETNILIV